MGSYPKNFFWKMAKQSKKLNGINRALKSGILEKNPN
jgi:hypothetical protein